MTDPERVDISVEDPAEQSAYQSGEQEGLRDLEQIHRSSGQSRESQMESAIKKMLGPAASGMTLEQIMELGEEELQNMIDGRKRKIENMQKIGKYLGKLLKSFSEKEGTDPVNMLLQKLSKIIETDPEKLKANLKDFSPEKRKEVMAVFTAFIEAATKQKPHAAWIPAYTVFVIKLFTDKEYLTILKRGTSAQSKLEQDLMRFGKVDPAIVYNIIYPAFTQAFISLNQKGLAGQRNISDIEQRLIELVPPMNTNIENLVNRKKQRLDVDIAQRELERSGSFEEQRIQKILTDVGKTLNTALDGLFDQGETVIGYTDAAGHRHMVDKESIMYDIHRFEHDEVARWGKTTVFLQGYLTALERDDVGTANDRRHHAQKISRLRTVIASRNALDFLRNSGNVTRSFLPFYERHFRYQIALRKYQISGTPIDVEATTLDEYTALSDADQQIVASATASSVRESVIFLVSNVYRNYLNMKDEPKEAYEQALAHGGDYTSNPREMFRQLNNMLGNLAHQSTSVNAGKLDFTVTTLGGMQTLYDPSLGKDISTFSSHRTQTRSSSAHDFLNELLEEIKADDGFFEAGHQYRFLSNKGSPDAQKKFFQSIGEHLKEAMTSRNIDRIYSMTDSVYLSRTASFIETILKKRMGEKGWINEDEGKFFNEIFLNKGPGGRTLVLQVQEFLEENYPHLPDWQRRRVLQHAFTVVFAGRFRYQQIFSYATPTRGYSGQAEDKQMFNNVYAPFQRLMRFPNDWNHDLSLKGAYWLPMYNMPGVNQPGKWNPFLAAKEGFDIFNDQKQEHQGRLAWDMSEYFQGDLPEAFAPINRLKAGGYDTLRGWRRMADWGVIDKKLYYRRMGAGLPVLMAEYNDPDDVDANGQPKKKKDGITRVWKAIENIGVNDVNAFVDADIVEMFGYDSSTGRLKSREAVDHFLGHLYGRYLHDGHEFGKHLPHNYLFAELNAKVKGNLDVFQFTQKYFNANMYGAQCRRAESQADFIAKFHARAEAIYRDAEAHESSKKKANRKPSPIAIAELRRQVLKPMAYDAMLVMIAERSPVEFLYRLKNQDEQNGLRLSTQIKNAYFDDQSALNGRQGASFAQTLRDQSALDDKLRGKLSDRGRAIEAKDEVWDQVTDDLAYVQGELRGEIDEEILAQRAEWEHSTKGLNIYGKSWDQERSSVNMGKGYVMDDDTLIRIMLKKFRPNVAQQIREGATTSQAELARLLGSNNPGDKILGLRIKRAVILRNDIISEMGKAPEINATGDNVDKRQETEHHLREKYLNPDGTIKSGLNKADRVKAERYVKNTEKRINRARWFRRMWDEGFLGAIPFMADNSEVHKVFLNGDDAMVFRSTGESGVAEMYKDILDARAPAGAESNMLLMLKEAARKGTPESWGKLKSMGNAFRKKAGDEIGDPEIFMPVFLGLYKMQLSGLANKQEVRNALGRWKMIFDKEGQSLFSKAWTQFEHNGMDAVTIRQFLLQVTKTGGMNPEQMEKFASFYQASWFHVAKELIPEYLTYILAFALVSYITSSIKWANKKN